MGKKKKKISPQEIFDASLKGTLHELDQKRVEQFYESIKRRSAIETSRYELDENGKKRIRKGDLFRRIDLWIARKFDRDLGIGRRFDHIVSWLNDYSAKKTPTLLKPFVQVLLFLSFGILKIVIMCLYAILIIAGAPLAFVLFWAVITAPIWIIALIVYSCG